MFFSVQQNTKAKSYLSYLIHYSEKIRGRPDHHHMSVKKITLSELLMSISEHTAKIGLHQDCMWSWYSLAASMVTAQHRAAWLAFPRDQQNSYWCLFLFTEASRLSVSTRDRHERASKAVAHFMPCNDSLIPKSAPQLHRVKQASLPLFLFIFDEVFCTPHCESMDFLPVWTLIIFCYLVDACGIIFMWVFKTWTDLTDHFDLFLLSQVHRDTRWPDVSLSQGPHTDGPLDVPAGDSLILKAKLPVPSVLLIHVCARPKAVPDQVSTNTTQCCIDKISHITLVS